MKLESPSFFDGEYMAAKYAAGALTGITAENYNPALRWYDVPQGTESFVLICHDPDAPAVKDDVGRTDKEIAKETPRQNFYHWLLIDIPAELRQIQEGEFSNHFAAKGKPDAVAAYCTRQGLNDYTAWSVGDAEMAGAYYGYDGPYPPFNDAKPHRYIFTLYALSVKVLEIDDDFVGADLEAALKSLADQGKVLAKSSITGLYTLNPRLAE